MVRVPGAFLLIPVDAEHVYGYASATRGAAAAHATGPVWAQGAALALEDALALADLLAAGDDWAGVGAEFERLRRPRVDHVQAAADKMSRLAGLPSRLRDLVAPVLGPGRTGTPMSRCAARWRRRWQVADLRVHGCRRGHSRGVADQPAADRQPTSGRVDDFGDPEPRRRRHVTPKRRQGCATELVPAGCSSDGEQEARNTAEATYQEAQEPLEQLIDGIWGPVDQAWPCGGGGADMRLMAVMVGGGAGAQARSAVELARLLGPGDPPGHLPE